MDIVGGVLLADGSRGQGRHRGGRPFPVLRDRHGGAPGHRPGGVPGVGRGAAPVRRSRRRCSPTTASSSPTGSARAGRCCSTGSAGRTASRTGSPSPRSPTTTGKVERFHQTLRRELLDDAGAVRRPGRGAGRDRRVPARVQHRPAAPVPGHGVPGRPVPAAAAEPTGRDGRAAAVEAARLPRRRGHRASARPRPPPSRPRRRPSRRAPTRWPPGQRWAGRSSSTGWCRRRATCRWPASSSGSARPAPGSR